MFYYIHLLLLTYQMAQTECLVFLLYLSNWMDVAILMLSIRSWIDALSKTTLKLTSQCTTIFSDDFVIQSAFSFHSNENQKFQNGFINNFNATLQLDCYELVVICKMDESTMINRPKLICEKSTNIIVYTCEHVDGLEFTSLWTWNGNWNSVWALKSIHTCANSCLLQIRFEYRKTVHSNHMLHSLWRQLLIPRKLDIKIQICNLVGQSTIWFWKNIKINCHSLWIIS